jgi:nitrate/TMAO reductase-like tetraheme cytochrome c subunit
MNRDNLDSLMCVYCEGFVAEAIDYTNGTQYCVPCHEYKSVITVREYLTEYEGLVLA